MNNKKFIADKITGKGFSTVEVISFNGTMAIIDDDQGPVMITKAQAMEFFGLVEPMELTIKTVPHQMLRATCKPVDPNDNIGPILDDMWELMYASKGCGLAANQVGVDLRMVVVHAAGYRQEIINPVITKAYGGWVKATEKCLSVPGKQAIMLRYKQIIVEGFDREWKPIKRKLKGPAARCVQHEVDHLNGITIGE
jgi:peptide deformylase